MVWPAWLPHDRGMRPILTPRLMVIPTEGRLIRLDLLPARYGLRLVAAQLKADQRQGRDPSGWWAWAVLAGRKLVGHVGFAGPPDASGTAELGFAFAEAGQGQGYGREAVAALLASMASQGIRAVWATTDQDNDRAQALMRAVGMIEQQGRWWFRYGDGLAGSQPE